MDNEKIKELAAKLAKRLYNDDESYHATLWWGNEPKERKAEELEFALKFLLETHCIVEKNEARETLEELKEDARPVCEWDEKVVDVVTLEDTFIYLFGKELFNDKEK